MPGPYVTCQKAGEIATISLRNPPLNVFKIEMTGELAEILIDLEADGDIRAVILRGEGKAFCAGSDITEFEDFFSPGQVVEKKLLRQNAVFQKLSTFPKPTIAAIHGLAYGGGLEISACCDLIVAEEGCKLSMPEMRLGVFPSSGGPYRVTRRIGEGRAKQLIFLAEPISANTALDWGLIDRIAAKGTLTEVALVLARELAKRPPLAVKQCKALIGAASHLSTAELIEQSLKSSDLVFSSADCREGVRAFFAKEKPVFGKTTQDKEAGDETA